MTISQKPEHREETRLDLAATIFIEVLSSGNDGGGNVIMCNSLDLSANGMQVVVDEDIAAGSIFRLCVDLKHAEPVFLVGEVMWKRPDEETDAYRLGFLLFESDDTDIQRWKEVVADLLVV